MRQGQRIVILCLPAAANPVDQCLWLEVVLPAIGCLGQAAVMPVSYMAKPDGSACLHRVREVFSKWERCSDEARRVCVAGMLRGESRVVSR